MKKAGILLPVFSLPGKYGIGTLGQNAIDFIDLLCDTGNSIWQILPMGPTGFGDSPYQSFSAFAGNPYFIDLETLVSDGLLDEKDLAAIDFGKDPKHVDYGKQYTGKKEALLLAYKAYKKENDPSSLLPALEPEIREYCVYMAVKDSEDGANWRDWPDKLRDHDENAIRDFSDKHADEIGFYAFVQTLFKEQWDKIHSYATARGIEILGDIPIYCAIDSSDVWAHRALFKFDTKGYPTEVAGVPPDAFSTTGQLWGNPLYDWKAHEKTSYAWWCQRITHCLSMFDTVRIDHFRGFESYYAIPYGEETAVNGKWEKGPGIALFDALRKYTGREQLPIVAEDLGVITDEVRRLMADAGFPGMKILQFAFDAGPGNAYLPHSFTTTNCICYTGTHDNDTLRHWFDTMPDWQRNYMYQYMSRSDNDRRFMPELLIKLAMGTIADTVIIPAQDYLDISDGRINAPGTTGSNWTFRLEANAFSQHEKEVMAFIVGTFGRYQQAKPKPEPEPTEEEASGEEETTSTDPSEAVEKPSVLALE